MELHIASAISTAVVNVVLLQGLSADKDDDAPKLLQPDITVTCDRSKLTEQGMTGPPDLVVEIVSPDSGLMDRMTR